MTGHASAPRLQDKGITRTPDTLKFFEASNRRLDSAGHGAGRQTEGLLGSLMRLLGLELPVPDPTAFSPRSAGLEMASTLVATEGPVTVITDSTGLKVFGAGEWHLEKHGGKARRTWRKLHLAVSPDTGEIIALELMSNEDSDASLVRPLLDQITRPMDAVTADGVYDAEPVYRDVAERAPDAEVIIPSRATAVVSDRAETAPTWRDRHIQIIKERRRLGWRRAVQYGRRALVEVAMLRYKVLNGRSFCARTLHVQKVEAAIGCKVMNVMTGLGMPVTRKVA